MRASLLETVLGYVTAPTATLGAVHPTAGSKQSFNVRTFGPGQGVADPHAHLIQAWANNQVAGQLRILSQNMHDATYGSYYERVIVGQTYPLGSYAPNDLKSADPLTVDLSGSAVGGQIEQLCMQLQYDFMSGSQAILLKADEVVAYRDPYLSLAIAEATITGPTAGDWGGGVLLSAATQALKINRYYAVAGISVNARCAAVALSGSDTGNVRIGCPGEPNNKNVTRSYFMDLSRESGFACVPVINAGNQSNISIEVACNQAGGTFIATLHLVMLAPSFNPAVLR